MRFISILISIFGVFLVYYGSFTPQYAEVGQQWTIIGGGFLFGGLFLYVYIGKKKE
tara:strand:- start:18 stop:185 length:168 start_codon:yes stop_codon:yes gene_type:complete